MTMRKDFGTTHIHPRTLAAVEPGSEVVVKDAFGRYRHMVATTGVTRGHDFMVVRVRRPGAPEPDAVPWPAEDVWLPGDAPGSPDA